MFAWQGAPAAHRGFLARARAVNTHALLREAQQRGLRLVFCGASWLPCCGLEVSYRRKGKER